MHTMLKVLKILFRSVLALAVGVLLAYNVYVLIARSSGNGMPKVFGFAFATVVSGSMEDTISIGDFIVIREQDEYAEGDIITFADWSGSYTTHRIIAVSGDNYITKGDANNAEDPGGVPRSAVVGKVVGVWRGFGRTVSFLQSPAGLFCTAIVVIVIWIVPDIVAEVFLKKKDEKDRN